MKSLFYYQKPCFDGGDWGRTANKKKRRHYYIIHMNIVQFQNTTTILFQSCFINQLTDIAKVTQKRRDNSRAPDDPGRK